jgi:hypothetical protein
MKKIALFALIAFWFSLHPIARSSDHPILRRIRRTGW